MDISNKFIKVFGLLLFVVGVAFIYPLFRAESGLMLEGNGISRLSDIFPTQNSQKICILSPYSVRSGPSQQSSMKKIFGNVDYAKWKTEIMQRHTDGYHWSAYLVSENNKIYRYFPLRVGQGKTIQFREPLSSGCYGSSDVCFYAERANDSKDIILQYCSTL